jgi:hypothetical protein
VRSTCFFESSQRPQKRGTQEERDGFERHQSRKVPPPSPLIPPPPAPSTTARWSLHRLAGDVNRRLAKAAGSFAGIDGSKPGLLDDAAAGLSFDTRRAFSYSAKAPAIWRIIFRVGSSLAVKSSPEAVSSRTPRLIRRVMPNSWAISSRANRFASSTRTVHTPLPSIRSRRAAKPARLRPHLRPLL